jgi:Glycosyltransferases, probably involved in cell wall biogenesis
MISVCIASYNGERYIKEQLDSIICQLGENDEIIISDDGSTDSTIQIIENFKDRRIKIFSHIPNRKSKYKFDLTTRNIENALLKAQGDYIFLADQDDIWEKNKIKETIPFFKKYDLILHDCTIIDNSKKILHNSYFKLNKSKIGIIRNLIKNSYLGCCMAFKREILKKSLPFPVSPVPHDIWIGLIAELKGNVFLSDKKLIQYRRHGNNLSPSSSKSNNSFYFKFKYRFFILKNLIKKLFI